MDGQLKRIVTQLFAAGRRRRRADLVERLLWEYEVNEAEADVIMVKLILDGQIHVFSVKAFNAKSGRIEDEQWLEPGPKSTLVVALGG